jgi:hypothetical protein
MLIVIYAECLMLIVTKALFMLCVFMLGVIMLNVMAPLNCTAKSDMSSILKIQRQMVLRHSA